MKHLLKLKDLDQHEILDILNLADQLKYETKHGTSYTLYRGSDSIADWTQESGTMGASGTGSFGGGKMGGFGGQNGGNTPDMNGQNGGFGGGRR